jgi:hypothetical protein
MAASLADDDIQTAIAGLRKALAEGDFPDIEACDQVVRAAFELPSSVQYAFFGRLIV